jgi:hypothetical protein
MVIRRAVRQPPAGFTSCVGLETVASQPNIEMEMSALPSVIAGQAQINLIHCRQQLSQSLRGKAYHAPAQGRSASGMGILAGSEGAPENLENPGKCGDGGLR